MSQEANGSPTWRPKEAIEAVTTNKRRSLSLVASIFGRSNSFDQQNNLRSKKLTKSQSISKPSSNIWTIELPIAAPQFT